LIARLMPIGYNPHSLVVSRAAIQSKGLTDFDGLLLRMKRASNSQFTK
jgi:hypothetical protein